MPYTAYSKNDQMRVGSKNDQMRVGDLMVFGGQPDRQVPHTRAPRSWHTAYVQNCIYMRICRHSPVAIITWLLKVYYIHDITFFT